MVLLVVVWVGSKWCSVRIDATSRATITFGWGHCRVSWIEGSWSQPWPWTWEVSASTEHRWMPFQWWFAFEMSPSWGGSGRISVAVPIWLLVILAGMPAMWVVGRDRWFPKSSTLCEHCGYDLRGGGHSQGKCPECGTIGAVVEGEDRESMCEVRSETSSSSGVQFLPSLLVHAHMGAFVASFPLTCVYRGIRFASPGADDDPR